LPGGLIRVGDLPFRLTDAAANGGRGCLMLADQTTPKDQYPEAVYEIPVGLKTSALYFLQTASVPAGRERDLYAKTNPSLLGDYVVNYADGRHLRLPLIYMANLDDWNSQRGPAQALGLWQGHTAGGALITLGAVEWRNPRPEVEIKSLDFTSALSTARPVLLAITAASTRSAAAK
jgi:beta-galactosidase